MAEAVVTITPEGEVQIEAKGVKGQSCQDLTRALEQSIGRTISDQKTPEFFQQATPGQQAQQ